MGLGVPTTNTVWLLWMGGEITATRQKSIDKWRRKATSVQLVDLSDVHDLADTAGFTIHPCFKYLSANHKSDYLRSHLMLTVGGLYSDVKSPPRMIQRSLRKFLQSPSFFAGHPELDIGGISPQSPVYVRENWRLLAGNTHFAFKPGTDFAAEWVHRVELKMDEHGSSLANWGQINPGRGPVDNDSKFDDYPIRWSELQGELFHKLQFDFDFPATLSLPRPSSRAYL